MRVYNWLAMEFREFFAKRLKTARMERNLTQARLGEISGIHEKAIAKYEAGNVIPTVEKLQKLASALNVSGDYFLLEGVPLEGAPKFKDATLLSRYAQIEELSEEERTAALLILDALISQHRIREITHKAPPPPASPKKPNHKEGRV